MKRSVLIYEPSEIVYKGLSLIINDSTTLNVLPQIENLTSILITQKPDLVIVNPMILSYIKNDGYNLISEILPDTPVVAVVYQYIEKSILQQYDGVIDIRDSANKVLKTITNVLDSAKNDDTQDTTELSDREKDVLVLITKGLMSKEIADNLNISIHTVITHRKNITRKTGIKSIAGLVAYALLNNLVDSSEFE